MGMGDPTHPSPVDHRATGGLPAKQVPGTKTGFGVFGAGKNVTLI